MNARSAFALPFAVCAALLGYGYYLQFGQGLEPCPLCLVQRGFFYAVGVICLLAILHGPRRIGVAVYGVLATLFALGGAATAARQVWLQHLPADKVPQCGPDLYFMLENLPLARTLEKLIQGSGECAAVDWKFAGLSIAGWSLVWFVLLAVCLLWLAARGTRRRKSGSGRATEAW
ncbi:MAG TPA: disulfide bond formation protein B [Burkholderiales bacterium]|nr:disulfide bond formation protein B [Burkholderiales bacterium]